MQTSDPAAQNSSTEVSLADSMLAEKGSIGSPASTEEKVELLSPEKVAMFENELLLLQDNLEKNLPGYKDVLKKIDKILKANPEITYVLKPEQIGLITKGLIKEADLQLFMKETKTRGSNKKLEFTGEDDI